ncbi:MAG: sensor histidine kinase [Pseudomonadota bacterium]
MLKALTRFRPKSLAGRLVVLASLWSLVVFACGGVALSWIFARSVSAAFDDRLDVLMDGLVGVVDVTPEGDLMVGVPPGEPRFREPFSGWYWQVEAPEQVEHSRSLWDTELPRAALEMARVIGPLGQRLRMLSRPVMIDGRIYRFRVAGDTASLTRETARFSVTVAIALAMLGAALVAGVLVQVAFGLRPLARLQAGLQKVRAGDDERLDGTFPTELEPVVAELNSLLAYNQDVIERARAHGGNLAHALKTPLSILSNEAERGDDHRLADAARRQLPRVERLITHHLARARMAGAAGSTAARVPVSPIVDELVRTLAKIYGARGVVLRRQQQIDAVFRGEREDFLEMLGNLLDNACKWATRDVEIGVEPTEGGFVVHVDDDGPGLPESERTSVIERGRRLDESVPGSGLGLAIVADHARLYRGSLVLGEGPLGGLRATLRLPGVLALPAVQPTRRVMPGRQPG